MTVNQQVGSRKIAISKDPTTAASRKLNADLSKIRCPIECWFGGFKGLWKFARTVFRLDHSSFDGHFEILGLLTNEHLKDQELVASDADYYLGLLRQQREKYEAKKIHEATISQRSRERCKRKRSELY